MAQDEMDQYVRVAQQAFDDAHEQLQAALAAERELAGAPAPAVDVDWQALLQSKAFRDAVLRIIRELWVDGEDEDKHDNGRLAG